ncbi:unnamed protein product, partial [Lota lota]
AVFLPSFFILRPPGPSAGVGGGGGRRGGVRHHAAPGARGAGPGDPRDPHVVGLHTVPHGEGPQAEGRHSGAPGRPPAGLRAPGGRLHPCLPRHLQGLHHCQHPHRAALQE